jgi:Flp pilus assembly protein TadD
MFPSSLAEALRCIETGDFGVALDILTDLKAANPKDPQVNYWLGMVYLSMGQPGTAVDHLQAAAKVAKKEAQVFATLADAFIAASRPEEALPHARKATALDPKSEFAHRILGDAYARSRRPVMAEHAYENALRLNPASAGCHLALSRLKISVGDMAEAGRHFRKAFELTPDDPSVLISAREIPEEDLKKKALERIDALLSDPKTPIPRTDRAQLAFTAGKICDDAGDYPRAFHFLDSHRSDLYDPYDAAREEAFFNRFQDVFTPDFFESRKDFALSSDRPVFVFGMPRSGTSLVESILSAHPKVAGAGEVSFVENQVMALCGAERDEALFTAAMNLGKRDAHKIGRKYLALLETYGRKNARVVDKLPQNFEHLWLLALLFPNATFIHTRRNPADTCVSIYMTPLSERHTYNRSQQSLAHYYGLYRNLMAHWQTALPVDMRHQSYEALVTDPDTERRALVEHTGLPWDDACSRHERNEAQVFTFSMAQVRQPIHTGAVNRFEKYRDHIQPLLDGLAQS